MTSLINECFEMAGGLGAIPVALALPAAILSVALLAVLEAKRLTAKPKLSYQKTKFNEAVLSRMPALRTPYQPLPFLTNGHVETIWAAKCRSKVDLRYRRETLHMPDGGIATLDWRIPEDGDTVRDMAGALLRARFCRSTRLVQTIVISVCAFRYLCVLQ
jgi:hypothetical protein